MCNYNLAQVKFNQSPRAQRNLCLPGKRRRRERRGRGEGEEEGKGEEGKKEKERRSWRGFPSIRHKGAAGVSQINWWEYLTRVVREKPATEGSGWVPELKWDKHTSQPSWLLIKIVFFVLKIEERERKRGISVGGLKVTRRNVEMGSTPTWKPSSDVEKNPHTTTYWESTTPSAQLEGTVPPPGHWGSVEKSKQAGSLLSDFIFSFYNFTYVWEGLFECKC